MTRQSVIAAVTLGASVLWPIAGVSDAPSKGPGIVGTLIPTQLQDERGVDLSAVLGVGVGVVYVPDSTGTVVALENRQLEKLLRYPVKAEASSDGRWIAVLGRGHTGGHNGSSYTPVLVITDATGSVWRHVDGVLSFGWSPSGMRIAVIYGREREEILPVADSLVVWTLDDSTLTSKGYVGRPLAVGWRGEDVLMLGYPGRRVEALDLATGQVTPARNRGALVSPSGNYSIRSMQEVAPEVWDDVRGRPLTEELGAMMDGARVGSEPGPFWVGGTDSDLLCLPACNFSGITLSNRVPAKCEVLVVKLGTLEIVRRLYGKGLGATADRRGVLVLRAGKIFVERLP